MARYARCNGACSGCCFEGYPQRPFRSLRQRGANGPALQSAYLARKLRAGFRPPRLVSRSAFFVSTSTSTLASPTYLATTTLVTADG